MICTFCATTVSEVFAKRCTIYNQWSTLGFFLLLYYNCISSSFSVLSQIFMTHFCNYVTAELSPRQDSYNTHILCTSDSTGNPCPGDLISMNECGTKNGRDGDQRVFLGLPALRFSVVYQTPLASTMVPMAARNHHNRLNAISHFVCFFYRRSIRQRCAISLKFRPENYWTN